MVLAFCLLFFIAGSPLANAETFLVLDNFPMTTNGDGNIHLQYLENGDYKDLKNLNSYVFGHPASTGDTFIRPVISLGERSPSKKRVNVTRIYFMQDEFGRNIGVMQINLPSATNGMHISGTAGTQAGKVHFLIYNESNLYSQPVWSSDSGGSFNISIPAQKIPQVYFSIAGKDNDQKNTAYWENLRIDYNPDLNVTPVTQSQADGSVSDSVISFIYTMNWQASAVIIAAIISSATALYISIKKK